MTTYRRGSLGPEVARIQLRLRELGRYLGPDDGIYGGGTESAVRAFQRSAGLTVDGLVGPETWRALFGPEPITAPGIAGESLDYRCLALTGAFETGAPLPECFCALSGDFDAQGLSFGALQWNLGQRSLQPLLAELDRAHPEMMDEVFQDHLAVLRAVLSAGVPDQLDWARSIQGPGFRVAEPWRGMFKSLGRRPECQQLQVNASRERFQAGLELCARFGLRTERGVALAFDVVVQNGGVPAVVEQQVRRDLSRLTGAADEARELATLQSLANRRAEAARPAFVEDVRARKLTIANGKGTVHGRHYNLEDDYAIRLAIASAPGIGQARAAAVSVVLSAEEVADAEPRRTELTMGLPRAASAPGRVALETDRAAWPADNLAPDYRHLGVPGSSAPFRLDATVLARLCDLNRLSVVGGQDEVIFGLRGCRLAAVTAGFVPAVTLLEAVPDYSDARCVLGVWRRSDGRIAAFQGSTVPNWKVMQQRRHGFGCHLLPTGRYRYCVGTHARHTAYPQPGALRGMEPVAVRRSADDATYDLAAEWDFGDFGTAIHAGRFDLRQRTGGAGPYFSSGGGQTLPGGYEAGRAVRAWAAFRDALRLSNPPRDAEDGMPFVYVLLTGREARLVSEGAAAGLQRLRMGSQGTDVEALQRALSDAGYGSGIADGRLGVETVQALVAWQQMREGGIADGIVSPEVATALGLILQGGHRG